MKNSFYLVIPSQKPDLELARWLQEKNLRRWLEDLPIANPALSTRLLLDFLLQANELEMAPEDRLTALEIIRPSFLLIEENLRSRLLYGGLPKSDNEHQVFTALSQLAKSFTLGYWITTRELTKRESKWLKNKQTTLALYRTLLGLANIVVNHYLMNIQIPDWVWMDIHSLYQLSIRSKRQQLKLSNTNLDPDQPAASIHELYVQILLLSLCQPESLTPREILHIYSFVQPLCSLVRVTKEPVPGAKQQCLLLADEDQPPFFSDTAKPQPEPYRLYLDFSRFLKTLAQTHKFVDPDSIRFGAVAPGSQEKHLIAPELYESLMRCWQGENHITQALFVDRLPRWLAIGFDALSTLVKRRDNIRDKAKEHEAKSASERTLSMVPEKPNVIAIGSLVCFRKDSMPHNQASLGIIRNIRILNKTGELVFEIKLLTHQFFAVELSPHKNQWEDIALDGLIYSDHAKRTWLIVESYSLKDGDILWMRLNQETFPIILRRRANIGAGYWRFECRRIEEKTAAQTAHASPDPTIKPKGFNFT